MTPKHFDQSGICHNSHDARILSFAFKLHCYLVKSARHHVKRLEANSQKEGCFCNQQTCTPKTFSSKGHIWSCYSHCVLQLLWDTWRQCVTAPRNAELGLNTFLNLEEFWSPLVLEPCSVSNATGPN